MRAPLSIVRYALIGALVALLLIGCTGGATPATPASASATPAATLTPGVVAGASATPAAPPTASAAPPAALCPEVARPALVYAVQPGHEQELLLVSVDGQTSCAVPLRAMPVGPIVAAGGSLFYEVIDGAAGEKALWRLGPDGVDRPLDFTRSAPPHFPLPFAPSADGERIAYTLVEPIDEATPEVRRSTLYVAAAAGARGEPLLEEILDEGRVLQPVRFAADGESLLVSRAPTAYGGMWDGMHGRYANLYRVPLAGGEAELVYECASGMPFCIGDVSPDGALLAAVDGPRGLVHLVDGAGAVVRSFEPPATDYIGFPTFGPGGELAFLSADIAAGGPPLPAPGYVSLVTPPYTGEAERWYSARGITRIWQWADAGTLILVLEGPNLPPVALLARDGATQPLQLLPQSALP